MGKQSGFLEYDRRVNDETDPLERIKNFNEFHDSLKENERRTQAARCMDCGVPFCQSGMMMGGMVSGCPLNNLIPEWNDLLYNDNMPQALNRLLKTNPFPEFTSRVCPAPCEAACTCGLNFEPVTIKENERAIVEYGFEKGLIKPKNISVRTGKKIAVIGSGPAGLTAAFLLNRRGHLVTVYEREDKPGGLLRYGIPNMKLEKQIIDRRVELMKEEGVRFVCNSEIATSSKAHKIIKENDAVILACGASNPRSINAPGNDAAGIYFAVDFLKSTTKSMWSDKNKDINNITLNSADYISAKDKNVLIIGGGDTGNDCVGTSIRHGAASVMQLEMMPKPPVERTASNPWPQWPKVLKTDYGQEEAIAVFGDDPRVYQTTVKEFLKDEKGELCGARLVKLEPKKDEKTGRMMMSEIQGSEYEVPCQLALIAAGFIGAQKNVADAFGVELNERTNVKTQAGAFETNVENVYVCGDMHSGQSLVVRAIGEGRLVAASVDKKLIGYSNI